ncbi:Plasma membrane-associated cation-binding protein 1 [Striga hermonthica]|uniref:Plasma membrane-associated cation-binding protein 1 n=1 Tax=Striga hermonthica TaxID=68872 RepID=A0A9N7NHY0_STRHE|nr:Plasma membrane-associated cation-binding protein 1 [Striga hermonthica]
MKAAERNILKETSIATSPSPVGPTLSFRQLSFWSAIAMIDVSDSSIQIISFILSPSSFFCSTTKMVNYWKSKVLPKIKKAFENPKKAAAAEACKAFDEAKEQYSKELDEKKTELQPKVVEIYEASSTEIKALVKEPKGSSVKKHSAAVQKKEFPGSKPVCEAATKVGPAYMVGPISFVLEKVSTLVVVKEEEEKKVEQPKTEPAAEEANKTIVEEKNIVEKEESAPSVEKDEAQAKPEEEEPKP